MSDQSIAKITWVDPTTQERQEYVLEEGATASIGRLSTNDIVILDEHVSRQHAVITYRAGVFVISDLGSINGTVINNQKIEEPFPLFAGDEILLYGVKLRFLAADSTDVNQAKKAGRLITTTMKTGAGKLIITTGVQEGTQIPLVLPTLVIGRATKNAAWEITIQDPSVSRPHARLERDGKEWKLYDLGSSNGTRVNDTPVPPEGAHLEDGDIVTFGHTLTLFRAG
jgi:pSer/pThr/pTyr-binding forkhead associated (FHA) protein